MEEKLCQTKSAVALLPPKLKLRAQTFQRHAVLKITVHNSRIESVHRFPD